MELEHKGITWRPRSKGGGWVTLLDLPAYKVMTLVEIAELIEEEEEDPGSLALTLERFGVHFAGEVIKVQQTGQNRVRVVVSAVVFRAEL